MKIGPCKKKTFNLMATIPSQKHKACPKFTIQFTILYTRDNKALLKK